jgi:hypothetical protein
MHVTQGHGNMGLVGVCSQMGIGMDWDIVVIGLLQRHIMSFRFSSPNLLLPLAYRTIWYIDRQ